MIPRSDVNRFAPWICAFVALLVSGVAVGAILSGPDANVTSLLRMAPGDPIATVALQLEEDLQYVPAGHYDGVYYYAIAIDPFATGEAHQLIDLGSHRYGHPGYGWLGWLASFGNPAWVPQALLILSLAGMAVAAFFASVLSRDLGLGPWGGAVIALNPGLIFSVVTDTSEAVTMALLAVSVLLWLRQQRIPAAALLAFLCFFKFQMILVPVGLGLWELVRYLRGDRAAPLIKTLALLAIGPIVFLAWLAYVQTRFGELPTSGAPEFLSLPFVGWFDTMSTVGRLTELGFPEVQLASAQLPILVTLLALFVLTIGLAARLRNPLDAVFLLQGLFVLLLNWWNLLYPKDLIRALAIPLVLLVAVLFMKGRTLPEPLSEQP